MKPKSNRGGKRAGAGRKHAGTVQQGLRIKPETRDWLHAEAKAHGLTLGRLVDYCVEMTQHHDRRR